MDKFEIKNGLKSRYFVPDYQGNHARKTLSGVPDAEYMFDVSESKKDGSKSINKAFTDWCNEFSNGFRGGDGVPTVEVKPIPYVVEVIKANIAVMETGPLWNTVDAHVQTSDPDKVESVTPGDIIAYNRELLKEIQTPGFNEKLYVAVNGNRRCTALQAQAIAHAKAGIELPDNLKFVSLQLADFLTEAGKLLFQLHANEYSNKGFKSMTLVGRVYAAWKLNDALGLEAREKHFRKNMKDGFGQIFWPARELDRHIPSLKIRERMLNGTINASKLNAKALRDLVYLIEGGKLKEEKVGLSEQRARAKNPEIVEKVREYFEQTPARERSKAATGKSLAEVAKMSKIDLISESFAHAADGTLGALPLVSLNEKASEINEAVAHIRAGGTFAKLGDKFVTQEQFDKLLKEIESLRNAPAQGKRRKA